MDKNIKKFIRLVLNLYPKWLRKLVKYNIKNINKNRFSLKGKIDASYESETGEILFWKPDIKDLTGFIIILSHEIGHKIFQEVLSTQERKEWLIKSSSDKLDISIIESYPAKKHTEEHFCWLFSAYTIILFLTKTKNLKQKEDFLKKVKKQSPEGIKLIKRYLRNAKRKAQTKDDGLIYHSQVIAFKKWLKSMLPDLQLK